MPKRDLYKLPPGWLWSTLNEISLPVQRTNRSFEREDDEFIYIDIESIDNKQNIINQPKTYTWRKAPLRAQQKINENDILFSNVRPYLKNVAMVPTMYNSAVASTGFCVIRPLLVNPKFVFYYVTSQSFINRVSNQSKGTSYPSVTNASILNQSIPIPSVSVQSLIIDKLDELFNEINVSRALLETAQHQLRVYEMVVLKNAFEGKLTNEWRKNNSSASAIKFLRSLNAPLKADSLRNPGGLQGTLFNEEIKFKLHSKIKSWATATLNDVVFIAGRIGWKGLKKEEYTTSGPLLVSVYCLNYGKQVDFRDANHISLKRYNESPDIKLQIGDVLLCKDGSGIGKVGIIKQLPSKATINSSLLILRGNGILLPDFLYYLLKGPQLQELVSQRISGSAVPHLFQKDIKQFLLVIPPIDEQKEIVDEIEDRLTIVEKLSIVIDENFQKIEVLKNLILDKAFKGQLVKDLEQSGSVNSLLAKIEQTKSDFLILQKQTQQNMPRKKVNVQESKSVLQILKNAKKPIAAKDIWLQSKHKDDIEGFYSELRSIQQNIIEIKRDSESLLSLRHEN